MRRIWSFFGALVLVCVTSVCALADITDYLGTDGKPSRCPNVVVVRPDISSKDVFFPLDASDFQNANNMLAQAIANKYEGALIVNSRDFNQYRPCDVPVVLAKLKAYSKEPAIFGQYQGKATVTILHFKSTKSDTPDKETDVSATGERHWGDSIPFQNAIRAVAEQIQKTAL